MSSSTRKQRPTYVPLSRKTIVLGIIAFSLIAIALVSWMVLTTPVPAPTASPMTAAEEAAQRISLAQLRVDIIRNALGLAAGLGGLAALVLAVRRQYQKEWIDTENQSNLDRSHDHQLRVAEDSKFDAAERRITELQIKAADQLGNEKAAVRLAGMYALERLAHDNSQHRQVVADIICAYLRMPHPAYPEIHPLYHPDQDDPLELTPIHAIEETVVRTTAQQILTRHMKPQIHTPNGAYEPNPMYWPNVRMNLAGADLYKFDGSLCTFVEVDFSNAHFRDGANFFRSTFDGKAVFSGAVFDRPAMFAAATFIWSPLFDKTKFEVLPDFGGARITKYGAGERVGLPTGWKVIKDQSGEGGLQFVKPNHPGESLLVVPG